MTQGTHYSYIFFAVRNSWCCFPMMFLGSWISLIFQPVCGLVHMATLGSTQSFQTSPFTSASPVGACWYPKTRRNGTPFKSYFVLARSTFQNKELRNKQTQLLLSSQNSLGDKALPLAFYPKPRNFSCRVFALCLETIPRAEFSVLSCLETAFERITGSDYPTGRRKQVYWSPEPLGI